MNEIKILLYICIFFILLSLLFLLYIFVSKKKSDKREQMNQFVFEQCKQAMYDYLITGHFSKELSPRDEDLPAFEKLLTSYTAIISGKQVSAHVKQYTEMFFTDYYKKMLNKKKWSIQINALLAISEFKMSTLTDEIIDMLYNQKEDMDSLKYYLIVKILVENCYDNFRKLFIDHHLELSKYHYREICSLFNENQWDRILSIFSDLKYDMQLSIIDSIRIHNRIKNVQFIENLLFNKLVMLRDKHNNQLEQTNELIIRCLKTVAKIGITTRADDYQIFIDSESWQERMMVIRLFGQLRNHQKLDILKNALCDTSYLVRKEAAQSIMLLSNGYDILNQLYRSLDDRYAKDAIQACLEMREI